jgi:hypothetical protein
MFTGISVDRTRRVVENVVADEATGGTSGLANTLTHDASLHKLMGEPYRLAIRGDRGQAYS